MIALLWLLGRALARLFRMRRPKPPANPVTAGTQPVRLTFDDAERLLATALLCGEIDRAEYQGSMEVLARADAAQHPLDVPPT